MSQKSTSVAQSKSIKSKQPVINYADEGEQDPFKGAPPEASPKQINKEEEDDFFDAGSGLESLLDKDVAEFSNSNTKCVVTLAFLESIFGKGAARKFVEALPGGIGSKEFVEILNQIKVSLNTLNGELLNLEESVETLEKLTVPEGLTFAAVAQKAYLTDSGFTTLYSHAPVTRSGFHLLRSESASISNSTQVVPVLTATNLGGTVTQTPYDSRVHLMGYLLSKNIPLSNSLGQTRTAVETVLKKCPSLFSSAQVPRLPKVEIIKELIGECTASYKAKVSGNKKLNLQSFKPIAEHKPNVEKFFGVDEEFANQLFDPYCRLMYPRAQLLGTCANSGVVYSPGEFAEDRQFRESVKDLGKEPFNVYSLYAKGASVVRKYQLPLAVMYANCGRMVAYGHSAKNNWEQLLKYYGVKLIEGDIKNFNVEVFPKQPLTKVEFSYKLAYVPQTDFEQALDADISYEYCLKPVQKEDEEGAGDGFELGDGDQGEKEQKVVKNALEFDVVDNHRIREGIVSDVFFTVSTGGTTTKLGYKPRAIGAKSSSEFVDYYKFLLARVHEGYMVCFKIPGTSVLNKDVFDVTTLLSMFADQSLRIVPFFQARMHNGEVVVIISKHQVRIPPMAVEKGVFEYSLTSRFVAGLSGFLQFRMAFANKIRNYFLARGIMVTSYYMKSDVDSILMLSDEVTGSSAFIRPSAQTSLVKAFEAPDDIDVLDDNVAKEMFKRAEQHVKDLQAKAEHKAKQKEDKEKARMDNARRTGQSVSGKAVPVAGGVPKIVKKFKK